jgi:hypothetical protein
MGLLRGVARTAAVAGTATAVSNRVSRRQAGRWAAKEQPQQPPPQQQQYAPQPQYVQQQPQYVVAQPAATAPVDPASQRIEQLKQLGELKAQGVLTEAEFQEQKRRIIG